MPIQTNQVLVGVGNNFGVSEFDEVSAILNQLVGIEGRQTLCTEESPCRAPRERRFLRLGRLSRGKDGFCVVRSLPAIGSRTAPEGGGWCLLSVAARVDTIAGLGQRRKEVARRQPCGSQA